MLCEQFVLQLILSIQKLGNLRKSFWSVIYLFITFTSKSHEYKNTQVFLCFSLFKFNFNTFIHKVRIECTNRVS